MALSSQDAFAVLTHELAHPLARMGSEADILALEAVKELERAYGPGPQYEAAKSKIMAQRVRVREAHQAAEGALRIGHLLTQADLGSISLNFRPVRLSSLVEEAVERSAVRTMSFSVEVSDGRDQAVCDEGLMHVALGNLFRSGWKGRGSPGDLRVRLRRDDEDVVVSLPWSIPLCDAPLDVNNLGIFIARRILELHDGILRCTESETPETELCWPHGLTPGQRSVPLRRSPR